MLAEHKLEAEKKEKELEERVWQFQAAQAAPGPQARRPPGRPSRIIRRSTTPGSSASLHGPARRAWHWCR
jgi:hypothetical protein